MDDETLDRIIAFLKANGKAISEQAKGGDELAKRIIRLYTLYYNFPEHVCGGLLEATIDEYQKREMAK